MQGRVVVVTSASQPLIHRIRVRSGLGASLPLTLTTRHTRLEPAQALIEAEGAAFAADPA